MDERRRELIEAFTRRAAGTASVETAIPGLTLHSRVDVSSPGCHVYDPGVSIILQGRKHVTVGEERFVYDASRFLLTTVDLPVSSCVTLASPEEPYMSMRLALDLARIRQLILDYDMPAPRAAPMGRGMATGPVTPGLLGAFQRLLGLLDAPEEAPVLADLIRREIAVHLLRSEQGARLWHVAMAGPSHRLQQVLNWLRHHYAEPLRMEELAAMAAMSASSMHQHFRELTSMSPLQFQKQLRLQEARRLMLVEGLDAGGAAVRVGYESASQFSREYARLFGRPPLRDIKGLRAAAATPSAQAV